MTTKLHKIKDRQHYLKMLAENPNATIGVSLAAKAIIASRGWAPTTDTLRKVIGDLKEAYGENMTPAEVRFEMIG